MHASSQSRRTGAQRRLTDPVGRARRRSRLIGLALVTGTLVTAAVLLSTGTVPLVTKPATQPKLPPANITVDFGTTVAADDPAAIGVDESTYGTPSDIHDPKAQALLKKLGVRYARLWLTLANPADPASRIICGAAGCDPALNPDRWISMMEAAGETPVIGIPDTLSAADATAIVGHFAGPADGFARPVLTWVIGNEPESVNESVTTYDARFNTLYDAMRKAAPQIKIGGPATLNFDQPFLEQFLKDCGSRTDFVDFHFYPGHETASELVAGLSGLSQDLAALRTMIKTEVPSRAPSIAIHVGEWNFSADPGTLRQYAFTGFASTLDADILGRILTAGADSLAWGSKNGPMSLIYGDVTAAGGSQPPAAYQLDTPMPLYEGISMFTGQGLFPRFGTTVVSAKSSAAGVDAFASANPDEIVLVNTAGKAKRVTVRGSNAKPRGAAEVWQLTQPGITPVPPASKGIITSDSTKRFRLTLPADSVTTLVMTARPKSHKK